MTKRIIETKNNMIFCVSVVNTSIMIIVYDCYTCGMLLKFFSNVEDAREYIKNIEP